MSPSKPVYQVYSVEREIADFFTKTPVTRSACDARAQELVGGEATIVAVQGACSYTVYTGPRDEFVVQFRLKSLAMKMEMITLGQSIYGSLVPSVSYHGQMGQDCDGKEPLLIYVMDRVQGVGHLDFIVGQSVSKDSPESSVWRGNLVSDFAKVFAVAWKNPQDVDPTIREDLRRSYETDLQRLLAALPERFHLIIRQSIDMLPSIFSFPMVLLHRDFGYSNIMVDDASNHLVGIIDWAEAEIGPFGLNLYCLQHLMGHFHLKNGWSRYSDYEAQQKTFWTTFCEDVGGLSEETIRVIKSAMLVGFLLCHRFTSRLANMPAPEPIRDDEKGAYNMLQLDGLLIVPATKFMD